jgi:hypothetical protein
MIIRRRGRMDIFEVPHKNTEKVNLPNAVLK